MNAWERKSLENLSETAWEVIKERKMCGREQKNSLIFMKWKIKIVIYYLFILLVYNFFRKEISFYI